MGNLLFLQFHHPSLTALYLHFKFYNNWQFHFTAMITL